MALRAVIFDLGGTLMGAREGTSPEQELAEAAPAAIRLLPPAQAAGLDPLAVGRAVRRAFLDLEDAACAGDRSPVPAELVVRKGLASLGLTVDAETARAMLAALYVPANGTSTLLPGATAALRDLAGMGLRLGVISNRMHGGPMLAQDLAAAGLDHVFEVTVASSEAGQMKPHPAIFELALRHLGVGAAEAVMVGDDPRADIGGALGVGMRAVWVRRHGASAAEAPGGVPSIGHLDELVPIIRAMVSGAA